MTPMDDLVRLVRGSSRIAVVVHLEPDPDAVGSALGLALALKAVGKEAVVLCDDPLPPEAQFLPGIDRFGAVPPDGFAPELIIAVDTSDTERLGRVFALLATGAVPVINIDHHVTNLRFGTVNLIEPGCAAAAELLVAVIDALDVALSPDIATCLLAGLVGDTRSFSTSTVTPATLAVAARLVEAGADLSIITEQVFTRKSFDTLRLWGLALSGVQMEDGIIWTSLPYAPREAMALSNAAEKGLSNLLLNVAEASVSAVFTEQADGRVVVSFRARPGYDVSGLALSLGGGGHRQAAGCTVSGPLDQAVRRVLDLLKERVGPANEHPQTG